MRNQKLGAISTWLCSDPAGVTAPDVRVARSDRCAPVGSQEADLKHIRRIVSGSVRVHLQTYRTGQLDAGTRD